MWCSEITERHSISDFSLFNRALHHYRSQGFGVAIDDMGTGYSGLMRIARLRPEYLKADMSPGQGHRLQPHAAGAHGNFGHLCRKGGRHPHSRGHRDLHRAFQPGQHGGCATARAITWLKPDNPKPYPQVSLGVQARARREESGPCSPALSVDAPAWPKRRPSWIRAPRFAC